MFINIYFVNSFGNKQKGKYTREHGQNHYHLPFLSMAGDKYTCAC